MNAFDKAYGVVHGLCDGTRKFTMSVPVRDDDSDMVLMNAIDLGCQASDRLARALPYLKEYEGLNDKAHLCDVANVIALIKDIEYILNKVGGQ